MRTLRACSADQCVNTWQTCCVPPSGALCENFSANRAWPDSSPGTKRFALHGASLSASRLKSCTSVTLALAGMVAHTVTGLASASVHARPAPAEAAGGEAVPGALVSTAGLHVAHA